MAVEYLFDTSGKWIAYRVDERWVWSPDGRFIGWCPWPDDPTEVVTVNGDYLGHIVGNRLLRKTFQRYRGYPGYPGYPGYAGYLLLPPGMTDVPEELLRGES